MSDLRTFDPNDPAELSARLDEFVERCRLVMQVVLQRNYNEQQVFVNWLRGLISESDNPFWVLHEDPLYLAAEYLNMDMANVESGPIANAYLRLAQQRNW
jgi:hypothetical protein